MLHYNWMDKIIELDPKGYLINDRGIAENLMARGLYTEEVDIIHNIIREYSNPNKSFVDIGAHVGVYSWLLAPHFKHVYSFEPNRDVYNYLCGNIALKGLSDKIDTHCVGISNKMDSATYHIRSVDGGGNGFQKLPNLDGTQVVLSVVPLDIFDIEDIGLIKIDVEGHEKSVIEGAVETLKKSDFPPILFESWAVGQHWHLDDDYVKSLREELFETIEGLGYEITKVWTEIFIATKNRGRVPS